MSVLLTSFCGVLIRRRLVVDVNIELSSVVIRECFWLIMTSSSLSHSESDVKQEPDSVR